MKAIETNYKGYRFRSRLEARWAVFFDALNLQWEYEPEGFDLGNGRLYLPDFRVTYPGRCLDERHFEWFEVKPDISLITDDDWRKLSAFGDRTRLMLLDGPPSARMYLSVTEITKDCYEGTPPASLLKDASDEHRTGWALWCGKGRLWWDHYSTFFVDSDMGHEVAAAVNAARAARFGRRDERTN